MKRALLLLILVGCAPKSDTPVVQEVNYWCVEVDESWGYDVRPYYACQNGPDTTDRLYFWLDEVREILEDGSVSPSSEWIATHALPIDAFVFDGSPNYDHHLWDENR